LNGDLRAMVKSCFLLYYQVSNQCLRTHADQVMKVRAAKGRVI